MSTVGGTWMWGKQSLPKASTVPPGQKRTIRCSDGFGFGFAGDVDGVGLNATVTYQPPQGASGKATTDGVLQMLKAWDNCETSGGSLCRFTSN